MTSSHAPHILLINPWIHDFAAYDFWAKPLGLLTLGGILRDQGARVSYLDCLDRFHPFSNAVPSPPARCGRGPYLKTVIAKPPGLDDIPRNYCRYGIPPDWFRKDLEALDSPDLVLVTSLMTYWYPGVRETIDVVKSLFPDTPLVLGGIYVTLCPDHARNTCGADQVITGPGEGAILPLVAELTGWSPTPRFDPHDLDTLPRPVLDLEHHLVHVPVLTSRGCPFQCAYCASHRLQPRMIRRSPASVVDGHIIPLLEGIVAAGIKVRFHTPNALHIREITRPLARLMFRAGFYTIRLGLETTAFERRRAMDRKVTEEEFIRTVGHLKAAGFSAGQVGAYLLAGLPGQDVTGVEDSVAVVKQAGVTPVIAHYTPIPHTAIWKEAVTASRYDLEADPVFTNNAIFPCQSETFSWEVLARLKNLART
ncbi:MAG: cobalamin B12-binding domain-containing protein [Desulfosarcina sp.]|nr:cobalamin B12-binding domain-containing protein [Desulfosarcina sp.]